MHTLLLLGALGCARDDKADDTSSPETGVAFTDAADVLVIGAGPAGVAAALSAREAGAEVRVLDRSSSAGDGIGYAGLLLAAGSPQQADEGITDSPEQAAEEWASITGVSGDAPSVLAFLTASAPTLAWLEGYGLTVLAVNEDEDAGPTARIHWIDSAATQTALVEAVGELLRLQVQVDSLVVQDGRVIGARWTDLTSGETGATRAGAVILATGGFLRDRARVDAWRPELADRRLLYETNPHADGGGMSLLDGLSPGYEAQENIGVYVHSIQDPEHAEGEALILSDLEQQIIVDGLGARFADESSARSLDFFSRLPEGEVFAIVPNATAQGLRVVRPPYNAADPSKDELLLLPELEVSSDEVFVAASPAELAALTGIDPTGLEDTLSEVNALIEAGGTDAFGRSFLESTPYGGEDLLWAVRLTPGLAKGYGGLATDLDAHLLDEGGAIVPGVYVVGELAGMIPGGGAGTGFAGSVNACYYGGRVAGANAAADAKAGGGAE